jgi:hypothetical protein
LLSAFMNGIDEMMYSFRNIAIGVGVGALVVAAATPSLALPNLPAETSHDRAHGYGARVYGDPYGGYAYVPDYDYGSRNNAASQNPTSSFLRRGRVR